MAQLESMGHSVLKPNLNDTEFESKMDEILAEDREDNTQAVSTTPWPPSNHHVITTIH